MIPRPVAQPGFCREDDGLGGGVRGVILSLLWLPFAHLYGRMWDLNVAEGPARPFTSWSHSSTYHLPCAQGGWGGPVRRMCLAWGHFSWCHSTKSGRPSGLSRASVPSAATPL